LTVPVMVGVHTAIETTTITTHPSTAYNTGVAVVTTGVLASASVPQSTMASPAAVYARLAYSLYVDWTGFPSSSNHIDLPG